ncbi:hypothetical protein GCM10027184_02000 [Saccharothrix stipae]
MAGGVNGPVVQAHTIHGGVHLHGGASAAGEYLRQVERIAPAELVGRDAERRLLAEFCTSPETEGRYTWWRADAWSGKTALLSWFVLNPPPKVRVVSFFVTARLAGQNDRYAFLNNLLVQLLALLRRPRYQPVTPTLEIEVLGLLAEAAELCRARGEHFVLIVDGLDEDRGFDGSPDAHSVAAFLPVRPPGGMRVIVSGRPFPPIPQDVPEDHPLRDPGVVHRLTPSSEARTMRIEMERDLKRLVGGTATDRDLLGMLTASGGGLSIRDLAELTGTSVRQVEDRLHTVAGRSFVSRPGASSDVYLLAHEGLRRTAVDVLGPQVDTYRERLHRWADSYRDRRWPPDTPGYVLLDHYALLTATGDVDRVVEHATDPDRHRRLRVLTGTDGAALGDIAAAQDLLLRQEEPDVVALIRLAVHRNRLHQRNSAVPSNLPAGWSRLGEHERAEQLVEAMPDLLHRVDALLLMSSTTRGGGDPDRADALLDKAAELALPLNQFLGAWSLTSVAKAYAAAGNHDGARHCVDHIGSDMERAEALADLAAQAAAAGDRAAAADLLAESDEILDSFIQGASEESVSFTLRRPAVDNLVATMLAAAELGDSDRVTSLLQDVEERLSEEERLTSLASAITGIASVGDHDRAIRLMRPVDHRVPDWASRSVIRIVARDDPARAESLARATDDDVDLCAGFAEVVRVIAPQHGDRARQLVADIEDVADRLPDPARRSEAMLFLAGALAEIGDVDRASAITRRHASQARNAPERVLSVAAAALRKNDLAAGREFLLLTEELASTWSGLDGGADEQRWVLWIRTMVDVGDVERAERLAGSLGDETARSASWAAIAEGTAGRGMLDVAAHALERVSVPALQRRARLELIRRLAVVGDVDQATSIARAAAHDAHRAVALGLVAQAFRENALLDDAACIAASLTDPLERLDTVLHLLMFAARLADDERATALTAQAHAVAQAIEDSTDDRTSTLGARQVARLLPARVRTATELEEALEQITPRTAGLSDDDIANVVPVRDMFRSHLVPVPERTLAWRLTTEDWRYHVEEVVGLRPDAYAAVVAELDRVGGARA